MSLTTDLETMRDAVQRTADVVAFTDKHPVAYINKLINRGLGALSLICRNANPKFQPVASTTITADGLNTVFGLPAGFRSLLTVEYTDTNQRSRWLTPFEDHEHAALSTAAVAAASLRATAYRLLGTNLELLPKPPLNHKALVWYATSVTQLASDAATFDTVERLDSYVIWWAAREISNERENWQRVSVLTTQMADLEAEIRILARSLDLSHPARMVEAEYSGQARTRRRRGWGWGR